MKSVGSNMSDPPVSGSKTITRAATTPYTSAIPSMTANIRSSESWEKVLTRLFGLRVTKCKLINCPLIALAHLVLSNSRYVALKILVAENKQIKHELDILHHLAKSAPEDGPQHITQLLAEFDHEGPNGIHKCLVFEPMGPSANAMVYELPQFKPRKYGMQIRYPPQLAKRILKQTLQGLGFLHKNGVAHGDFQPGNILFAIEFIDSDTEASLRQEENVETYSISAPVERLDGKEDKWAPRYLCMGQPLAAYARFPENIQVKLSDMGGGKDFIFPCFDN